MDVGIFCPYAVEDVQVFWEMCGTSGFLWTAYSYVVHLALNEHGNGTQMLQDQLSWWWFMLDGWRERIFLLPGTLELSSSVAGQHREAVQSMTLAAAVPGTYCGGYAGYNVLFIAVILESADF